MNIVFENLGPIKSGAIELGKLTIVAGKNNTGKTYITYSIFSILRTLSHKVSLYDIAKSIVTDLNQNGKSTITITVKKLSELLSSSLDDEFDADDFAKFFSSDVIRFKSTKVKIHFDENDLIPTDYHASQASLRYREAVIQISIKPDLINKAWDIESTITGNIEESLPTSTTRQIQRALIVYFLQELLPKPYLSTSERLGIALFYKDLDSNRNALVEHLQEMASTTSSNSKSFDPFEFVERATSRFAFPIHENINFIRKLESVQKNTSDLADFNLTVDYPRFGRHLALFAPDLFKCFRGHSIEV